MVLQTLQVDQTPPFVTYFQWKKISQKVFWEKYLLSMENFNTYLDPKRKRPKPENILDFRQKIWYFALEMMPQCFTGDVVLLPHVSTQLKGQAPGQRTSFMAQHGLLLVSSFPSPTALFCRTPCSQQTMDACGIVVTILTRSHGSVFDSLFGVFTEKCSGFDFFRFCFFPKNAKLFLGEIKTISSWF